MNKPQCGYCSCSTWEVCVISMLRSPINILSTTPIIWWLKFSGLKQSCSSQQLVSHKGGHLKSQFRVFLKDFNERTTLNRWILVPVVGVFFLTFFFFFKRQWLNFKKKTKVSYFFLQIFPLFLFQGRFVNIISRIISLSLELFKYAYMIVYNCFILHLSKTNFDLKTFQMWQ